MRKAAEGGNEHAQVWFINKADSGRRLYQRPKVGQKQRATVKKSWHKQGDK
jgi:hypothetical protein